MPDRIAQIVILAEDQNQANLVRRYLLRAGQHRIRVAPLAGGRGAGESHVRRRYPQELNELRRRASRISVALFVVLDADTRTVADRARQLDAAANESGIGAREANEPIAHLIPKRNVETWIFFLLGEEVDEVTDYSNRRPDGKAVRRAGETLFDWSRDDSLVPEDCPPSLRGAFPELARILV